MRPTLVLPMVVAFTSFAHATTWDEPWHETVVRDADAFIRGRVEDADAHHAKVEVLKRLGGSDVPDQVLVDRFSQLDIGSSTVGGGDEELSFPFTAGKEYYIFLQKEKGSDRWAIATPTTGFAGVKGGLVYATYRHSYHQALVPEDLYERSMAAIFQSLHGKDYDRAFVHDLFQTYLTKPPAGGKEMAKDEKAAETFFRQHVALECFYYFGDAEQHELLEPFLSTDDFHVRISAVRALSRIDTAKSRERLWQIVTADGDGFARVMALWGLKRLDAREYLPKLKAFAPDAPDERTGFGGNLMDPRVGTKFPGSVRRACNDLVEEWQRRPKP